MATAAVADYPLSFSFGVGPSSKTFWIAVAVEAVCIAVGLTLALVMACEAASGLAALMAALPFLAVAVIEVARIPLTRAFFNVRGRWKVYALVGIVLITGLTTENLTFGFERAFTARISEVRRITQQADDAAAETARLDAALQRIVAQRDAVQAAITQLIEQDK